MILPAQLAAPAELRAGVDDLAGLCGRVAHAYLTRRSAYLDGDAYEDLVSYLLVVSWSEAQRFDGRGHLAGFIGGRLKWRCTDWMRSRLGRGRAPRPAVVSLEALPLDTAAA